MLAPALLGPLQQHRWRRPRRDRCMARWRLTATARYHSKQQQQRARPRLRAAGRRPGSCVASALQHPGRAVATQARSSNMRRRHHSRLQQRCSRRCRQALHMPPVSQWGPQLLACPCRCRSPSHSACQVPSLATVFRQCRWHSLAVLICSLVPQCQQQCRLEYLGMRHMRRQQQVCRRAAAPVTLRHCGRDSRGGGSSKLLHRQRCQPLQLPLSAERAPAGHM